MLTVTQNKNWSRIPREGPKNFSSLIRLDNELRCSIASLLKWVLIDSKVMDEMQAMILSKMNNHTSKKSKSNREQDTSKRKHQGIVSRFEPSLYVPAFTTMKDFTIL